MKEKTKQIILMIKNIINQNIRWIIMFFCLVFFLIILENVFDSEINNFDEKGYNLISKSASSFTTAYAKTVTKFANPLFLTIFTIIIFLAVKNKKIKFSIPVNIIIAVILNCLLKVIIQRPRPTEHRIIDETRI